MVIDGRKKCAYCQEPKLVEHFSRAKSTIDGLQYYCKSCQAEYRRDRKGRKLCDKCKTLVPVRLFFKSRMTNDGLFGTCIKCCKVKNESMYRKPDKVHYDEYLRGWM